MSDPSQENKPLWDSERAASLVGKSLLIGVTYLDKSERLVEQKQLYGTIISADPKSGITVQLGGNRQGEAFKLPPDLAAIQAAKPGEYRLRSTGETVVNPDLVTTWTVTAPKTSG